MGHSPPLVDAHFSIGKTGAVERARVGNVQLLRALAASSVLFSHAADVLFPGNGAWRAVPWSAGVDLFFVISGFVMMLLSDGRFGRPGSAGHFLVRRIIRIVPCYWFFTLLMVALLMVAPTVTRNTMLTAPVAITSFLFIPWPRADGLLRPLLSQGWTLNYEAFFYCAFALALLARRGILLLSIAFVALVIAGLLFPAMWFVAAFYSSPIILEFLAGMGLAQIYIRGVRIGRPAMAALAALAVIIAGTGTIWPDAPRLIAYGVPALLLAAAFILRPEAPQRGGVRHFGEALGDASYALYLSHPFAVNGVGLLLGTGPFVLLLALAGSIGFAMIFHRWVERPVTEWLNQRAGERPQPLDDVAP